MIVETKREISKVVYDEHVIQNHKELSDWIENEVAMKSSFPPMGYGYYGGRLFEQDGKYYVSWRHADSCD